MANTKNLKENRAVRKGVKRSQRRRLKALRYTLTPAENRQLRKEPMGLRKFVAEVRTANEAAAKAAKEAAAAKAAEAATKAAEEAAAAKAAAEEAAAAEAAAKEAAGIGSVMAGDASRAAVN